MSDALRAYARTFPSQGGVEIGDRLIELAAAVPPRSAIVEVGSWLGAGTAHLALGAMTSRAPIHVFDRWYATGQEIEKAAKFGVQLKVGEDTLPRVKNSLTRFPVSISYYRCNIRRIVWSGGPIGLYVDDASKGEDLWNHVMSVFKPSFLPAKTMLVLQDYHFDESAGPKYAAQKRWIAAHRSEFEFLEDRLGGTTVAIFRYLG